jgi:hypothetical protein
MRRWPFSTMTMPTSTTRNRNTSGMQQAHALGGVDLAELRRGSTHTTLGEDASSDMPLPDAALGDHLTHPHHRSAVRAGEHEHDQQHPGRGEVGQDVDVGGVVGPGRAGRRRRCGNRNARAVDCSTAIATVRYRVHWVILRWPRSRPTAAANSSQLGDHHRQGSA